jgi:hypothetical protein
MTDAMAIFRELGSVAEMRMLAAHMRPRVMANNAHLHLPPNFSAFTTVQQVLDLAESQQCRIIGASNYYDYDVYDEFAALARRKNIFPLFGLEIICMIEDLRATGVKINDPGNPGKMYICGKGIVKYASMSENAQNIMGTIRKNDSQRTRKIVERLSQLFTERGLPNQITTDTIIDMIVRRHGVARHTVYLQERHVAQALQEYVFAQVPAAERMTRLTALLGVVPKIQSPEDHVGVQNELRSHLMKAGKPGYVVETFIEFAPAMQLILELGGFASYPILADGNHPICPFEDPVQKLIGNLRERHIYAAELITGRNNVATAIGYAKALRSAGIMVTVGTEHNTLDLIPMVPMCLKKGPVPEELQEIFYEGACVIAAHQFLTVHGDVGYVDRNGILNAKYASHEERITELAKIGDTVIRKYLTAA